MFAIVHGDSNAEKMAKVRKLATGYPIVYVFTTRGKYALKWDWVPPEYMCYTSRQAKMQTLWEGQIARVRMLAPYQHSYGLRAKFYEVALAAELELEKSAIGLRERVIEAIAAGRSGNNDKKIEEARVMREGYLVNKVYKPALRRAGDKLVDVDPRVLIVFDDADTYFSKKFQAGLVQEFVIQRRHLYMDIICTARSKYFLIPVLRRELTFSTQVDTEVETDESDVDTS